jgi:hypothetical protein
VGADGPWDIKRVLRTVSVEANGSACFTVPANTPIFMQPLDDEGKAWPLMRSWTVAMPGEVVSCVGCHEDQNSVVAPKHTLASPRKPTRILSPGEFHADTTELIQRLRDGKHDNVHLDADSWQTLYTWIDSNAPWHGTWAAVG